MESAEMLNMYQQVDKLIKEVAFDSIWKGFSPYPFVLYGGDKAVLDGEIIPRTQEFLANTAIVYQGRRLAIWDVVESYIADVKKLTSKIIHEMFHAEQGERQDNRWANEVCGAKYDYNVDNLVIKTEENRLLSLGIADKLPAKEVFEKVVAYRKYRKQHFPDQFEYEMRTETMEGTAQFVESQALRQLSPELYSKMLQTISAHLDDCDYTLKMRYSCYDSGTAFLLLASLCGVQIPYELNQTETIFDLISKDYPAISALPDLPRDEVEKAVTKLMVSRDEIVAKSLTWKCENIDATVVGFDPLNTFFHNDVMYTRYLSVLSINGETQYMLCEHAFPTTQYPKVTKIYKNKE